MVQTRTRNYLPPPPAPSWVKKAGCITGRQSRRGKPRKVIPSPAVVKSGRVGKDWPTCIRDRRSKGFWNPGATCYRNAMLQCLIHQPTFFNYLGKIHGDCLQSAQQCVVCALQALMQSYWNYPTDEGAPALPQTAVETLHAAIAATIQPEDAFFQWGKNTAEQGDPHEFLGYLLAELGSKPPPVGVQFDGVFKMKHWSVWTCKDCGADHEIDNGTHAADYGMSIGISYPAKGRSLARYIKALHNDTIDLACDSPECTAAVAGIKARERSLIIRQAPQVLFIKMDIYEYNREKRRMEKQKQRVPYAPELDLSDYLDAKAQDGMEVLRYRLDGVVVHVGEEIGFGHYYAAVRRQNGTTFCSVDDEKVRAACGGAVKELLQPRRREDPLDGEPYILVYSRQDQRV